MRGKRGIPDWLWMAGLMLLLSLHFWFPRIGSGPPTDTFGTGARGKKAFYRLIKQRLPEVDRNFEPLPQFLANLPDPFDTPCVLCLLGPARSPSEREWEAILDWVNAGGSLVIAAREDDKEFSIDPLEIKVTSFHAIADADADDADAHADKEPEAVHSIQTDWEHDLEVHWHPSNSLVAPESHVMVQSSGGVLAVSRSYGSGKFVVVASDDLFSNKSLTRGDNSVVGFRLIESAGPADWIYFDESLNSSGTPKIVGLLLEPFLRPLTVQLLVGLLIFAWCGSRQFGPLMPRAISPRRNIVDHTDTLGNLLYRSGNGAEALKNYLDQLVLDLGLKRFKGQEHRILEPIARRLGCEVDQIKQEFVQAEKAVMQGRLDRRTTARLIRKLAFVRECSLFTKAK